MKFNGKKLTEILTKQGRKAKSRLAAKLDVSYTTIQSWCACQKSPPIKRIDSIAKAVGVQPVDLLDFD